MKNKHVLITGGVKGIGLGCVKTFLDGGAKVSVLDIDPQGDYLLRNFGEGIHFLLGDVSKEDQVSQGIKKARDKFGEIDVLVNNAGIQRYSKVADTSEEEWDLVMNVNLKSAFLCSKHTIPSMQRLGKGVIILISSVQAFVTQENVAPYATSKTAMLGLARSIAIDYAPTIRCIAVCPGTVDTPMLRNAFELSPDPEAVYQECVDMHLLQRIAQPEEIGELVYFLSSDKANFITGQAIRIDAGLGAKILGSKR